MTPFDFDTITGTRDAPSFRDGLQLGQLIAFLQTTPTPQITYTAGDNLGDEVTAIANHLGWRTLRLDQADEPGTATWCLTRRIR